VHFLRMDQRFSESLHRVNMKQRSRILSFYGFADLRDRLQCADFIIRMHNGDQNRIIPDRVVHCRGIDPSVLVHIQISNFIAFRLQEFHGFQNRRMFDLCCDQMFPCPVIRSCRANEREIVGLGSARGKINIPRTALQNIRKRLLCAADIVFRHNAFMMHAGRIAVIREINPVHQLRGFRKTFRRRGIVQIDFLFHSLPLSGNFQDINQPRQHGHARGFGPQNPSSQ